MVGLGYCFAVEKGVEWSMIGAFGMAIWFSGSKTTTRISADTKKVELLVILWVPDLYGHGQRQRYLESIALVKGLLAGLHNRPLIFDSQ